MSSSQTLFPQIAIAAFPHACQQDADEAAKALQPFVYENYRITFMRLVVLGNAVQIPLRIHFLNLEESGVLPDRDSRTIAQCLCTRSTDGYVRQRSSKNILDLNKSWAIPYVVLLAGEYVVEIANDIYESIPRLDREAYGNFVRENQDAMEILRSRTISYWNCYYRHLYPDKRTYPGLKFIHQLELWAS